MSEARILRFDAFHPGEGYVTMLYSTGGKSIHASFPADMVEDLARRLDRAIEEARA